MASLAIDMAVIESCLSSSRPFSQGQRLFLSRASVAGDCSCSSDSGLRSRRNGGAGRVRAMVVCGLQWQLKGDFSPLSSSSSSSSKWPSNGFVREFSRGSVVRRFGQNGTSREKGRRGSGNGVVTMALPIDAYWITAAQALAVAFLMGGIAVVSGILINIRIEVQALAEFKELEEKGLLPDEMFIPDGDFELDDSLYIFQNMESSSSKPPSRNRPVREEFEPELETEIKTELETAAKE